MVFWSTDSQVQANENPLFDLAVLQANNFYFGNNGDCRFGRRDMEIAVHSPCFTALPRLADRPTLAITAVMGRI